MVYNCFTVKSVFIPKQLLLTYKIRHYSFQVFTDKFVRILIHKGSKVSYQHLFTQTNYKEKKTIQQ